MEILQLEKPATIYVNGEKRIRFTFVDGVCDIDKMGLDEKTKAYCLKVLKEHGYGVPNVEAVAIEPKEEPKAPVKKALKRK